MIPASPHPSSRQSGEWWQKVTFTFKASTTLAKQPMVPSQQRQKTGTVRAGEW